MNKVIKIDIGRIFKALLKKWYFMVIAGLIVGGIMYYWRESKSQRYSASVSLYSAAYGSVSETTQIAKIMQSYASVITSNKISERAASILGDNTITGSYIRSIIGVGFTADSPILYISATDINGERAVMIANAVAEAFIIEAQNLTGSEGVRILDKADEAYEISNSVKKYTLLGALAGIFVMAVVIAFFEIFSDRVYRVEDAELGGQLEIIGVIPDQKGV